MIISVDYEVLEHAKSIILWNLVIDQDERLANWLGEEQVGAEQEEDKCAMICEALGELVSRYIN